MFTNTKALVFIASCALLAQAQSDTTTAAPSQTSLPAGLDQCIITCSSQAAAAAGCGSFTNLTCVCTSVAFQSAAGACLVANCTQADLQAAQQISSQQCAAVSSSSTAASTATSSATQSATSSSAAMALDSPFSLGGLLGTLVASAGALVGAAIVL
ncbi:hypothetical protein JVT61DRAFT_859 [Boletus reticuloceps]|uniref:CFEM domain-containing protein n=1 Tax=Boletus reticuloceps TaxID=495285 RepID=A0A8I3AH53_9AGAM|nr:hypothetical protein JVT61DRAFT_859 [Boletus reticuloceps]